MINNVDTQSPQTTHYFQEEAPFCLGLRLNAQEDGPLVPNIADQRRFPIRIASGRLGLRLETVAGALHPLVCCVLLLAFLGTKVVHHAGRLSRALRYSILVVVRNARDLLPFLAFFL